MSLLLVLDLVGTFVFAISGAVVGVTRRLDMFGILFLSFVAGNFGGITRDVLIGSVPPAAISEDSKEKRLTSAAKAQALGFFSLRAPSMPYSVRHFHEKSLGVGPAPAIALDATDQPLTIIANLD